MSEQPAKCPNPVASVAYPEPLAGLYDSAHRPPADLPEDLMIGVEDEEPDPPFRPHATSHRRFSGIFLLSDLLEDATDLKDLTDRLAWWSGKLRQMHREGIEVKWYGDERDLEEVRVVTDDPALAERWELEEETDEPGIPLVVSMYSLPAAADPEL